MDRRRPQVRRIAAVLVVALASAAPLGAMATPLRVGDHVAVQVFNHPELSGERVVDSDGTISVPLAGSVTASGLEPAAVAARVTAALKRYLPFAAVDVQRKSEGAAITVAGWPYAVPDGVAKYLPGQTLAGAIAAIRTATAYPSPANGAFDPYHSAINMRAVSVDRDGSRLGVYDTVKMAGNGQSGPTLRPGDVVRFVNKPVEIRITGAVRQPGYAYLDADEPLADAIDQVGGMTDNASTSGMVLRRSDATTSISVADPAFHAPAAAGDTLDIPPAPQVVVAGVVLKPGTVLLKNDPTLLSAVFNAGGPDKDSDLSHIRLVRGASVTTYDVTAVAKGDFSQNPALRDGDEVVVPRGRHIDAGLFASIVSSLRWIVLR